MHMSKALIALPIAGALILAAPAPKAEAFFVLPVVAAAAMFGAFAAGGMFGSATTPSATVADGMGGRVPYSNSRVNRNGSLRQPTAREVGLSLGYHD